MLSTISYRTTPVRPVTSDNLRRRAAPRISLRHELLSSSSMAAVVDRLESAIARINADPNMTNTCEVALFEIDGDDYLHCNVTHRHATRPIAGWAGPGHVAAGFVYNRRFLDGRQADVVRQIRDMVCAAPV